MADFNQAFDVTMGHEGGYANHPADKGGLTYRGITFRDHPTWAGWVAVRNAMRQTGDTDRINRILASNAELQQEVRKLYKREFWDANRLDQVENVAIAIELFDTGVNCGVGTAALFLQRSLNVSNVVQKLYPDITPDGKIGPVTLGILNKHPYPTLVLKLLNTLQGARYIAIAEKNPSQEIFIRSWFSRVNLAA